MWNKILSFIKEAWHDAEPLIKELVVFAFLIFAYAIADYFTKPFLPPELKDKISTLKNLTFIAALSLLSFHALSTIFIRVINELKKEVKGKDSDKDDTAENDDEDDTNQNSESETKQLTPKLALDEISKGIKPEPEKVKQERDEQN